MKKAEEKSYPCPKAHGCFVSGSDGDETQASRMLAKYSTTEILITVE